MSLLCNYAYANEKKDKVSLNATATKDLMLGFPMKIYSFRHTLSTICTLRKLGYINQNVLVNPFYLPIFRTNGNM